MKILFAIIFITCLSSNSLFLQASASPAAAVVPNHSGYLLLTSIPHTYHVVGEVSNTGTVSLTSINVTGTFFDSQNNLLGHASSLTMLTVLAPMQKSPFEVVLIMDADQVSSYTLSLSFAEFQGSKPSFLEITNVTRTVDISGFTHIMGKVVNHGSQNATYTKVAATFFNASEIISAAYEYCIPSTIEPESDAIFEIIPSRKISANTNVTLVAESQQYSFVPELSASQILVLAAVLTLTICFAKSRKKPKIMQVRNCTKGT